MNYYYGILILLLFTACDSQISKLPMTEWPVNGELTTDDYTYANDSLALLAAEYLLLNNKQEQAIQILRQIEDKNHRYFYLEGLYQQSLEQSDSALKNHALAFVLAPHNIDNSNQFLKTLILLRQYEQAFDIAQKVAYYQADNNYVKLAFAFEQLEREQTDSALWYLNQTHFFDAKDQEIVIDLKEKIYLQDEKIDSLLWLYDRQIETGKSNTAYQLKKLRILIEYKRSEDIGELLPTLILEGKPSSKQLSETIDQLMANKYFAYADQFSDIVEQKYAGDIAMLLIIARYQDQRYRYAKAAELYRKILEMDQDHQIAHNELANVNRKIAYLRRQKEEEEKRLEQPLQQIESIKF